MRRFFLYGTAGAFVLALVTILFAMTGTKSTVRPCERCETLDVTVVCRVAETAYYCRKCGHTFDVPSSCSFSWTDAALNWMEE